MRRVQAVTIERDGEIVEITVRANAFLHHMVRNIAGSLILVGAGERPVDWLARALAGRDRTAAGPTAPPQGLYFAGVEYDEEFGLPCRPRPSGRLRSNPSGDLP
jgi:tRNA pseudouridine38-40 synthase